MIQIHINPVRVEKVVFISESEIESDYDLAAWMTIQPLVNKIDKALKATVSRALKTPGKGLSAGSRALPKRQQRTTASERDHAS